MHKHRNSEGVRLTAKNVAAAIVSAIENKELDLRDWLYIKEIIDSKYELKDVEEPFVENHLIKWVLGY